MRLLVFWISRKGSPREEVPGSLVLSSVAGSYKSQHRSYWEMENPPTNIPNKASLPNAAWLPFVIGICKPGWFSL